MTLTIISDTNQRSVKDKSPIYNCQCHCGVYIRVKKTTLNRLNHCGCELKENYKFDEPKGEPYPEKKSKGILVTIGEETKTISEWMVKLDSPVGKATIKNRLATGMDPLKAFTLKVAKTCEHLTVGDVINKLTILEILNKTSVKASCTCGEEVIVSPGRILNQCIKDCGCSSLKVGGSPTYSSWSGMKARCLNPNNPSYLSYGGRGIKVCERWMTYGNFIEDMGERTEGQSIERLDVNGDYTPMNCIWLDKNLQQQNTRSIVSITIEGETHNLTYWLNRYNVSSSSYRKRINNGMTPKEALNNLTMERKRTLIPIEFEGEILTLKEAWRKSGSAVSYSTVQQRVQKGMKFEQAILKKTDW